MAVLVILLPSRLFAQACQADLTRCAARSSAVEHLDCYNALACCAAGARPAYEAVVTAVEGGDSVTVTNRGSKEPIRLSEIDAPDRPEPYASEAGANVTGLLMRQFVFVQSVTNDQSGRTVADIVMSDGESLSRDLVDHGYAWLFIKYSSNPELAMLEREVRAMRCGLWQDPSPTAPWDFRDPLDRFSHLLPSALSRSPRPRTRSR